MSHRNEERGMRIKGIRLELGKTQEEFGAELVPPANKSLVSKWERGDSQPSSDRLKQIAEIGKVSVRYLITGAHTPLDEVKFPTAKHLARITTRARSEWGYENININSEFISLFGSEKIEEYTPRQQLSLVQFAKYVLTADPDDYIVLSTFANYTRINGVAPSFPNQRELDSEKAFVNSTFQSLVERYFANARVKDEN